MMSTFPSIDIAGLAPEIILVLAAATVLLADLVIRRRGRILGWFSLVAFLAALAALLLAQSGPASPVADLTTGGSENVQGMATADALGLYGSAAILVAAALAVLLSLGRAARDESHAFRPGPFYALLLLTTAGMATLTIATDLLTIFLSVEILSVGLYILVGFHRGDPRSDEAALKYFLLGAFASGFLIYGIALIYGATGTTSLAGLAQAISPMSVPLPFAPLLPIGVGLLLVAIGFKLALVPFHMWTPDVYQGAPTTVTAFMSVATKAAVFVALIRIMGALTSYAKPWLLALAALSVLSMTLGNFAALRQESLKRMLAYSSIAQAGYMLIGIASGTPQGTSGALYYLLAYTFMTLGAFGVLLAIQRPDANDVTREEIAGLGARQPVLAVVMSIFMFSLAGIPPLAGFFGKLYVFQGAVDAGLVWLAVIGALNSAIAAYYYLRVTVLMFMAEHPASPPTSSFNLQPSTLSIGGALWAALGVAAIATLVIGIYQIPWMQGIARAVIAAAP